MAPPIPAAILDDYQHVAFKFADWSPVKDRLDVTVFDTTVHDEDELVKRLEKYEIICTMRERTKFTASTLDRLPNLKLISTTGMVNRGIDVDHARSRGIVVSGTGAGRVPRNDSTLEHIWALLLATVRYVALDDANTKASKPQWQSYIPLALGGHTLGLVGVGRLGAATAKIAKAFGMRVIGWSPHLTPERAEQAGVEFCPSKETLFETSDIVSVHMVLSDSTRGMVDANDLSRMKSTAFIINTSRGPLIDENALVDVLQKHKIAGAGLDVFDVEPLPLDHPLRTLDNITLTPHTGYVSDFTYEVFWEQTVENIAAFLDGNPKRIISSPK